MKTKLAIYEVKKKSYTVWEKIRITLYKYKMQLTLSLSSAWTNSSFCEAVKSWSIFVKDFRSSISFISRPL